jgi:serine protease Do
MTEKPRKDYRVSLWIVLLLLAAWILSLLLLWNYKQQEQDHSEIIQQASQAVVAIKTKITKNRSSLENQGSGFCISPSGLILTNEHVVHDADIIRVTLADKRMYIAQVIAADVRSDLAILQIEADKLPVLPIAPAEDLAYGQVVIALGNPFGTGADGTPVSNIGRINRLNYTSEDLDIANDRFYDNMIQTTAVVYPGNSGGPLIDKDGFAVGLNTAMGSSLDNKADYGFAIAFDKKTRLILQQLIAGEPVSHAFLGVTTQEVDEETRKKLQLKDISGVLVSMVLPGSPAQQAGIRLGDVIRTVDEQDIYIPNDLIGYMNNLQPGIEVRISCLRKVKGKTQEFIQSATLEERIPKDLEGYNQEAKMTDLMKWGMRVKKLTSWRRQKLRLPQNQPGVLIYAIEPDSPADRQKYQPGTVIIGLGQYKVDNLRDFAIVAEKYQDLPKLEILKRQN